MESPRNYLLAKQDAVLFFDTNSLPLIIDEVQRVSDLCTPDARDPTSVKDESRFYSFMVACAARPGRLFSASDIGNAIDADHKTVKAWLSVLQASNIVRILYPFWPNVDKRLTKTLNIYFMDTGQKGP